MIFFLYNFIEPLKIKQTAKYLELLCFWTTKEFTQRPFFPNVCLMEHKRL